MQPCSDRCCLGDIGIVTVVDQHSDGDELWQLARDFSGRSAAGDQARWIPTQARRARVVSAHTDLRNATWTAHIRRLFVLDSLFANHDFLMTGRIRLVAAEPPEREGSGKAGAPTPDRIHKEAADVRDRPPRRVPGREEWTA